MNPSYLQISYRGKVVSSLAVCFLHDLWLISFRSLQCDTFAQFFTTRASYAVSTAHDRRD